MNSVLLIDKPEGITSYTTIEEIKRLLKIKKIGHSGTLDKFASGLLVTCTGWTTKLTKYFLNKDKRYIGTIKLGTITDTDDPEGTILEKNSTSNLNYEKILDIRKKFIGVIHQVPPKYSALKINCKRASDLTRKGIKFSLAERKVHIKKLDIIKIDLKTSIIIIDVLCSKGTYIRSLARDIGKSLNTGAHLQCLRRISSGLFSVNDALTLEEIQQYSNGIEIKKNFCLHPEEALSDFGSITIKQNIQKKILNGSYFQKSDILEIETQENMPFMILNEAKKLIAIADIDLTNWVIKYLNVFNKC